MASSLNKVMLIGNLGADPIIRQTQDGKKLAQLSLATSESWKDKNTGERRDKTQWHRIVIFNDGLAGVVENYLKKDLKSTLRDNYKLENLPIIMELKNIQLRLFWQIITVL